MVVHQLIEHIRQRILRHKNADFGDFTVVVQRGRLAEQWGGKETEEENEEVFHGDKFGDFFGEWGCLLQELRERLGGVGLFCCGWRVKYKYHLK